MSEPLLELRGVARHFATGGGRVVRVLRVVGPGGRRRTHLAAAFAAAAGAALSPITCTLLSTG